MAKTHFHSNSQQRWFKPSVSMGLKGAQYSSIAASRVCLNLSFLRELWGLLLALSLVVFWMS